MSGAPWTPCYRQRTRRGVIDSDATLILSVEEPEGGTLTTLRYARQYDKPLQIVLLDQDEGDEAVMRVAGWLGKHDVYRLNIAGPRESKQAGIYHRVRSWLQLLDECLEDRRYPPD